MKEKQSIFPSPNRHKQYVVTGQLVSMHDREDRDEPEKKDQGKGSPPAPEILTIWEVAKQPMVGMDTPVTRDLL